MCASSANELVSPSSSAHSQPCQNASFQRKEFQVTSSEANVYTPVTHNKRTPSPVKIPSKEVEQNDLLSTDEEKDIGTVIVESKESSSIEEKSEEEQEQIQEGSSSKKASPSNQKFLTSLKSFNIDKTKYRHYGHQSSMNEQSLSKIINESSVKQEFDSENNSPISSNRIIIDEKISQILGLPEQIVEEESFWPYNVDTLNEILRFKVEQERTRQESIKNEFGTTAVELLKLAKSMNISGDLIPFLFISSGLTSDSLKVKINKLKSEPQEVINEITQKSSEYIPEVSRISSLMSSNAESSLESAATTMSTYASSVGSKRKFSDTQLPSFSETAESIKGTSQSNFVSPTIRSPNRSPSSSHKRGDSDSSDIKLGTGPGTGTGTGTGSAASPVTVPLPLPPTGYAAVNSHQQPQPQSQQHSKPHSPNLQPPLPVQGNVYPVYYTPQPTTSTGKGLGSPYSHKYQPVMYPGPPQPPPNQFQPNYITQPPPGQPYQYFIPSPPNNGQYILQAPSMVRIPTQQTGPNVQPPPPSQQIPPHRQDQQPVPSHQFQSPPESGGGRSVPIFKPAEMFEETSPYKKQKSAGKSQSINFMITTPKNPPARKYNNPHKEK